jgi:hypothetical protein
MTVGVKKVLGRCTYNKEKYKPIYDYLVYEDDSLVATFKLLGGRELGMYDKTGKAVLFGLYSWVSSPTIKAIEETYHAYKHLLPTSEQVEERELKEQVAKQKKIRDTQLAKEHYAEQMYDFICVVLIVMTLAIMVVWR